MHQKNRNEILGLNSRSLAVQALTFYERQTKKKRGQFPRSNRDPLIFVFVFVFDDPCYEYRQVEYPIEQLPIRVSQMRVVFPVGLCKKLTGIDRCRGRHFLWCSDSVCSLSCASSRHLRFGTSCESGYPNILFQDLERKTINVKISHSQFHSINWSEDWHLCRF